MKIFVRFDSEKQSRSFSDVKLLLCVNGNKKTYGNDEYETFDLLINSKGRYRVVTDVLDFEVL